MPPDIIWWILTCVTVCTAVIPPRTSCRMHYLANIQTTAVLPIGIEGGSVSNLVCHMPNEYEPDTIITEIHSGLEKPHTVVDKRSVNYQVSDLLWLRDEIRTSECRQSVRVEWKQQPETDRGSLTLVSLLNESIRLNYDSDRASQQLELTGNLAGIRHILPDEDRYANSATVTSGSLMCRQSIIKEKECLVHGKLSVPVSEEEFRYSFAFRTDRTDQSLFSLHSATPETAHFRLERDFLLRVDAAEPFAIGQLSDTNWHTVVIRSGPSVFIDGVQIPLKSTILSGDQVNSIEIKVEGDILLIDERDVGNKCFDVASRIRPLADGVSVESSPLCSGCECTILPSVFENLPSSACKPDDDESFHLLRDADRLSLFHLSEPFLVATDGTVDIRTAMTFKSDSDAGLLMFGYWHGMPSKGRWQVHYTGNRITAIFCQQNSDEACTGCRISTGSEIGSDVWHRVVFYGSNDDLSLVFDRKVCQLQQISAGNNISTAEVYSIPYVVESVGLFVGGTFYEKKKSGLYKAEFAQKYFENTREKMPSLRGCVKDVFINGHKVDLSLVYEQQMKETLIDLNDIQAYAIQIGCSSCSPQCPVDVRCRSPAPFPGSLAQCDCADVEETSNEEGTCEAREVTPVPLSTRFVSASPTVVPIDTTKAQLSKIWLKFRLPQKINKNVVIAEFNSHREIMLRVFALEDGFIHVQSHPHDINSFYATASKKISMADDRVHMVSLTRRTPVGTRHSARKFDLKIDGSRFQIPDNSKATLNNISFPVGDGLNEKKSVIVHDIGIGYDYEENVFITHPTNRIHQLDVHARLLAHLFRNPNISDCGTLDPYLWEESYELEKSSESQNTVVGGGMMVHGIVGGASAHGDIVQYTPDAFRPQLLLSSRWLFYSLILCFLLCLLLLICLCLYCCILRKRRRGGSTASDREHMMRDSPDYVPVKMRRDSTSTLHDDTSIGTWDTDLKFYEDIPSHRVRINRESMVSILVPSIDQPQEAAIVKRPPDNETLPIPPSSPLSPYSASPPPSSPAPLVSVREDEQ